LILVAGGQDGYISIHEYRTESWKSVQFQGHGFGVNSISWAPIAPNDSDVVSLDMTSEYTPPKFVTTGNDDLIKVWEMKDNNVHSCHVVATLEGHESAVRDAQWRPSYTGNLETIASGGDVLFFLDY
jgi:WD40 repeat protein